MRPTQCHPLCLPPLLPLGADSVSFHLGFLVKFLLTDPMPSECALGEKPLVHGGWEAGPPEDMHQGPKGGAQVASCCSLQGSPTPPETPSAVFTTPA